MRKIKLPDSTSLPIIADGAIATVELGEGRLIPVLVVDCAERSDVRHLIDAHQHLPPGDVKVTWGRKQFNKAGVFLYLEFERPARVDVLLEFNAAKQGTLVDGILHSRGVYLQPKESGQRVIEGLENIKILIEVPDTGFLPIWELLFTRAIVKRMRKKGLNRKDAKSATAEHIKRIRELWSKRMDA